MPIEGELGRFHVDSQRAGQPAYLVDLLALDCNAVCGCPFFEHKLYKLAKAQLLIKDRMQRKIFQCIHIHDCREFFMQEILFKLKDKEAKGTEEPFNKHD